MIGSLLLRLPCQREPVSTFLAEHFRVDCLMSELPNNTRLHSLQDRRQKVSSRLLRSTRRFCSALTIKSFTTSQFRVCQLDSQLIAPVSSAPMVPPMPARSVLPISGCF